MVIYWDESEQKVVVHYFDSEFLGHTQAEQLLEKMKRDEVTTWSKKVLTSLNGWSSWKPLKIFQENRNHEDPDAPKMINLGSCGLHVMHLSFQDGERQTGWKVGDVLWALWQVFHDSPARWDDFIQVTKTSTFPLKFCVHRWVEDLPVAERALKIWPAVQDYIRSHKKLPKSKVPSSASYRLVKKATGDPLFQAKLQFFAFVARQLQPFFGKIPNRLTSGAFLQRKYK